METIKTRPCFVFLSHRCYKVAVIIVFDIMLVCYLALFSKLTMVILVELLVQTVYDEVKER